MSGIVNGAPFGECPERVFGVRGDLLERKLVSVSVAASGDTTLVSAVSGKRIRVLRGSLVAANSVTVQFESGLDGMRITGAMSLIAGQPLAITSGIKTNPGEALIISLGGAVQVSGWLEYCEITEPWESAFDASRYGSVILGVDFNEVACRNAGTGAIGDVVTTADPIDVKHRSFSGNKLTATGTLRYVQGTHGIAVRNTSDSVGLDWTSANNGRAVWKNLTGGSLVWIYTPVALSATNVLGLFYDNAGTVRTQLTVSSSNGSVTLTSRRVDGEASSVTSSANDVVTVGSPHVIVLSLNYAGNAGNCWINGTQVLTAATLSAGGAGTVSNTNGLYDSALFGSSETFNNPEGFCYAAYVFPRAVSSNEAISISNHIRYLRGF